MLRPALLALIVIAGCGGEAKKQPQQAPPDQIVDMFACTVSLTRKEPLTYTGSGTDADPDKATGAAWQAACDGVPAASRADCRDKSKFTPEEARSTAEGTHTVTVTLTPAAAKVAARSDLLETKEAACKSARVNACERVGVKDDCVASGAYVETIDEVESKKTVLSAPQ